MSYPDYSSQGWQGIVVSLDGLVAVVKLNRAKQCVRKHNNRLILLTLSTRSMLDSFEQAQHVYDTPRARTCRRV